MIPFLKRLLIVLALFAGAGFWATTPLLGQLSTSDHLSEPGFWPTQTARSRQDFVGAEACAGCHGKIVGAQRATPMGATAMYAADSHILQTHARMNFAFGPYRYEVETAKNKNTYSISAHERNLAAKLLWAFGTGRVGQSYLFKKEDGNFYEARVTYFSSLQNLHFTPARELNAPAATLEEAMYRTVSAAEISRCFGCHTTASSIGGEFREANLILGVSCEACHGAGAQHVGIMNANKVAGISDAGGAAAIFNPRQLSPTDSVDFCGACHGTWWDIKLTGVKAPSNIRSQPYRLQNSKCWGKGDARLTCIACHNPHEQLQTEAADYDHACLSCHVNGGAKAAQVSGEHPGKACPVAQKDCVSCHMPKVNVPEMHHDFTDHWIRIVRTGEPLPN